MTSQDNDMNDYASLPDDIRSAVREAFHILDAWQATPDQGQAILGIPAGKYEAWQQQAPAQLDQEHLERISYVLGIWKALRFLFPDNAGYKRWPQIPNKAELFNGDRPIVIMSQGDKATLGRVRGWLDGWCGDT